MMNIQLHFVICSFIHVIYLAFFCIYYLFSKTLFPIIVNLLFT